MSRSNNPPMLVEKNGSIANSSRSIVSQSNHAHPNGIVFTISLPEGGDGSRQQESIDDSRDEQTRSASFVDDGVPEFRFVTGEERCNSREELQIIEEPAAENFRKSRPEDRVSDNTDLREISSPRRAADHSPFGISTAGGSSDSLFQFKFGKSALLSNYFEDQDSDDVECIEDIAKFIEDTHANNNDSGINITSNSGGDASIGGMFGDSGTTGLWDTPRAGRLGLASGHNQPIFPSPSFSSSSPRVLGPETSDNNRGGGGTFGWRSELQQQNVQQKRANGTESIRGLLECNDTSSTETDDEDFQAVFFPSSARSPPVQLMNSQLDSAAQLPLSFTPVRAAFDAGESTAGLSTPVHSWINCAQQFMNASSDFRPLTPNDDHQRSLMRFLFSPAAESFGNSGSPPHSRLARTEAPTTTTSSIVTPSSTKAGRSLVANIPASSRAVVTTTAASQSELSQPLISGKTAMLAPPTTTASLARCVTKLESSPLSGTASPPAQSTVFSILSRYLAECPPSPWGPLPSGGNSSSLENALVRSKDPG